MWKDKSQDGLEYDKKARGWVLRKSRTEDGFVIILNAWR